LDRIAMAEPDGLILQFKPADGDETVFIEDNGRVAYAYLMDDAGTVCSDVWLYNRCAAPDEPEWTSPEKLPFANSRAYVRTDAGLELPSSTSDFFVHWGRDSSGLVHADVRICDRLVARLVPGVKPGWALLAMQDGPLARVLAEEPPVE
jgi:hypothetical protein